MGESSSDSSRLWPPPDLALGYFHGKLMRAVVVAGELLVLCGVVALYGYWWWYWHFSYKRILNSAIGDPHKAANVWARVFGHMSNLSVSLLVLPVR